jgi:uncharacterized membrane protein
MVLEIATWISNMLILGVAICIWCIAVFAVIMILLFLTEGYKNFAERSKR